MLARTSRLVVFVGTSFSVGVTAHILGRGLKHGARMFSIDPAGGAPVRGLEVVTEPAEVLLPRLVQALQD